MASVSSRWAPSRRMLVSTSWEPTAGRETIGLLLSRMVAYSGGECGCEQTKFKPKYAATFNSTHPQLSGIARQHMPGPQAGDSWRHLSFVRAVSPTRTDAYSED